MSRLLSTPARAFSRNSNAGPARRCAQSSRARWALASCPRWLPARLVILRSVDEPAAFTLPCGYAGPDGSLHREGAMRRARAGDEIVLLPDPRVKGKRAELGVLMLLRAV